jgi:hypothetical protein
MDQFRNASPAAKAAIDFVLLPARLKPRPFKTHSHRPQSAASAAAEAAPFQNAFTPTPKMAAFAAAEAAPFQSLSTLTRCFCRSKIRQMRLGQVKDVRSFCAKRCDGTKVV